MTPQLHLSILASGSAGNACVVEGPQGSILVDCGISRKQLMLRAKEIGCDLDRVRAVLLTHEHTDHTAGLSVFANRFDGPIMATAGTSAARPWMRELAFELVDDVDDFEVAGIRVRTFPTSHDVADPMGLRFDVAGADGSDDDRDALGYCTDTGQLGDRAMELLHGCRILALESNHDVRMLREGPYPGYLKARVGGDTGHLSNDQAAEALPSLVTQDTETIVAMHLSEKNNTPSTCIRTLAAALGAEQANSTFTEARTPDGHLTVVPASQTIPMAIY